MANRILRNDIRRPASGLMQTGIWILQDSDMGERKALIEQRDEARLETVDATFWDIYWLDELERRFLTPNQITEFSESEGLASLDITEEYLNDHANVEYLLNNASILLRAVFLARPEISVPRQVIDRWMNSGDRQKREEAIKLLPRMQRGQVGATDELLGKGRVETKKVAREGRGP